MDRRRFRTLAFAVASTVALLTPAAAAADADQSPARGVSWQKLDPASRPPKTTSAEMAYDESSQQMVLFGGFRGNTLTDETWLWDGTTWSLAQPDVSPSPRNSFAMAYDPVREQVVLFGGAGDHEASNETWVFSSGQWTELSPATSPRSEFDPRMAYDPHLGQLVMFDSSGRTWTWDGTTWLRLHPATSPEGRYGEDIEYDSSRDALVMFGGVVSGGFTDATWSWDGQTWTPVAAKTRPPLGHYEMTTLGSHVAVFGRNGDTGNLWVLKHGWKQADSRRAPKGRVGPVFEWDTVREEAILFGGTVSHQYQDTWSLVDD